MSDAADTDRDGDDNGADDTTRPSGDDAGDTGPDGGAEPPSGTDDDATPRRPLAPRLLKWGAIAAAVLVVLVLLAPTLLSATGVLTGVAETRASEQVRGTVEIESVRYGWLAGAEVRGVHVRDPDGRTVAAVDRVALDPSLFGLLTGGRDLGDVTVEGPSADVRRLEDGTWNVQHVLRADDAPGGGDDDGDGGDGGAAVTLNLAVSGGRVTVTAGDGSAAFTDLGGTIEMAGDGPIRISVTGAGPARLSAEGTVAPDAGAGTDLTVRVTGADVAALAPVVRGAGVDLPPETSGAADLDVTATHDGDVLRVEAALAGRNLVARRPDLPAEVGDIGEVTVEATAERDAAGAVRVTRLDVEAAPGTVAATATLDTHAAGAAMVRTADARTELDLVEVRRRLGPLLGLRDDLELFGRLTAVLSLQPDGGGGAADADGDRRLTADLRTRGLVIRAGDARFEEEWTVDLAATLPAAGTATLEHLQADLGFATAEGAGDLRGLALTVEADLDGLAERARALTDLGGAEIGGRLYVGLKGGTGGSDDANMTIIGHLQGRDLRVTLPASADGTAARTIRESDLVADLEAVLPAAARETDGMTAAALTHVRARVRATAVQAAWTAERVPLDGTAFHLAGQVAVDIAAARRQGADFVPAAADDIQAGGRVHLRDVRVTPGADGWALTRVSATLATDDLDVLVPGPRGETRWRGESLSGDLAVAFGGGTEARMITADLSDLCSAEGTIAGEASVTVGDGLQAATADLVADLGRLLPRLAGHLALDEGANPAGRARLEVGLEPDGDALRIRTAQLTVTDAAWSAGEVAWSEPRLVVRAPGSWTPAEGGGTLVLDGLSVEAESGTIGFDQVRPTRVVLSDAGTAVTVDGTLRYDLEKIGALLAPALPRTARMSGVHETTVRFEGDAAPETWQGGAEIAWDEIALPDDGVTLDAHRRTLELKDGVLRLENLALPVNGGTVEGTLMADFTGGADPLGTGSAFGDPVLYADGELRVRGVALNKRLSTRYISRIFPLLNVDLDVGRVDGRMNGTVEAGGLLVPLRAPIVDRITALGTLELENVEIQGSSLVRGLADVAGVAGAGSYKRVGPYRFQVRDGVSRVDRIEIKGKDDVDVVMSGDTGLRDGALDWKAKVPITEDLLEGMDVNDKVRKALEGMTVDVSIRGTLGSPKLDLVQDIGELIRKAALRLIPGLFGGDGDDK